MWQDRPLCRRLPYSRGSQGAAHDQSNVAFTANEGYVGDFWVIDSGPSAHMCKDREVFVVYKEAQNTRSVSSTNSDVKLNVFAAERWSCTFGQGIHEYLLASRTRFLSNTCPGIYFRLRLQQFEGWQLISLATSAWWGVAVQRLPLERISARSDVMVCSDVLGPIPPAFRFGFKYIVSFILIKIRCVTVKPLRIRNEVMSVLTRSYRYIRTTCGTKFKVFRSDTGGEFRHTAINSF